MAPLEDEEAAVVHDERQTAFLLLGTPADPEFAVFAVKGGGR